MTSSKNQKIDDVIKKSENRENQKIKKSENQKIDDVIKKSENLKNLKKSINFKNLKNLKKIEKSEKSENRENQKIGEFLEIGEFSGIGKILEIENARSRKKETTRAFASKREIPSEKSTLVGLKKMYNKWISLVKSKLKAKNSTANVRSLETST